MPDATAVSTTALHCLGEDSPRRTCRQIAALLRPGRVLVNADHFPLDDTQPTQITAHVGIRRSERLRAFAHEDGESWWAATAKDPDLAGLLAERRRTGREVHQAVKGVGHNGLSLSRHTPLPRQAGFAQAGPVWQFGNSHVLVAVR
ncbi:putative methyltransferase [Streptomyces bingchenggensis BCW-1]|uniref:Putative methyltransferase n=2 Tax=Streptomyces TaxID=1883 RepID=D7CDR6_STRBB|nr:putative methyltransferase [Streptomyces bingchenggensis BCW-1]